MAKESLTITPLEIETEGQRVIKLEGVLTLPSVFEFQNAMREEKSPVVILDFANVLYVDSAGIGAVIRAHVSCGNEKRRLILVSLADRVKTMLQVTGVSSVLAVFPTLKDAQASLKS